MRVGLGFVENCNWLKNTVNLLKLALMGLEG